jgi:heme exporter protein CcmB
LFADLFGAERMMQIRGPARTLWWLIHKDLMRELRAQNAWPGMLLLGLVLVFLLATQITLPLEQKARTVGGLLWLSIFFAGTLALERSFANERDSGCWQALKLYPMNASVLFLAKMAVNIVSLAILECVLVPAFIVLTDVPLLARPGPMLMIAALGSICFASIGTLLSALTAGLRCRGGLLAWLLLPLVTPVVLGAAEATRIVLSGETDPQLWQWIRLLAVFAVAFTIAGALLFEFVMEE